ncbi:hypothetical protein BKI52_37255 [marine bacterium AO1-C]|nr:hypothetical protein BKI52_37255 [marine bacterium AO1-C]
MKKVFLLLTVYCFLGLSETRAQAKIWRSIDLTKYPNTHLTAQDVGFRQVLIQGVQKGRVKVYAYRNQFADFKKRIPRNETKKVLQYYDTGLKEMVELRPSDFSVLEIQELYDSKAPNAQKYKIQAVALKAPEFSKSFVVKYKHFKRYLNKAFRRSRRKKDLMVLKAYWQSPENNTLQTSISTALESRKFTAKILKTEGLEAQTAAKLKTESGYQPKSPMSKAIFQAPWIKINKQTLRATARYQIDLEAKTNAALYQKGNGVMKVILEGIRKGKIKPYAYASTPQKYFKRLRKEDFFSKLSYYESSTEDTVDIQSVELHKLELVGYWEINTQTQKSNFKIERIHFLIPKGTNAQTEFGNLRLAQLKYTQVVSYLNKSYRKASKKGTNEATWVNPENNAERMSFAQALTKGLYKKQLNWFANQQDLGLLSLYDDLGQKKNAFSNFNDAQKYAQQYLENYLKK